MSLDKWILVAIGCVECGERSKFVGFYDSKAEATLEWNKIIATGAEYHHPLIEKVEVPTEK